jgi:hypothetical protein
VDNAFSPRLCREAATLIAPGQQLKAQCAFKLAELVETHKLAIVPGGDQDEITEEFSHIKQKDMDKDGKLKIVGKDEVRDAICRSKPGASKPGRLWSQEVSAQVATRGAPSGQ